jgi:hypothetical protein
MQSITKQIHIINNKRHTNRIPPAHYEMYVVLHDVTKTTDNVIFYIVTNNKFVHDVTKTTDNVIFYIVTNNKFLHDVTKTTNNVILYCH